MIRRCAVPLCAASAMPRGGHPLLKLENAHGFTHKSTRRFDELNITAYEWQHDSTGALYYHLDTSDRNCTFCIGFRTPAKDNKGISHVLEHTTLCGSKKYPVRDPFFMMLKRSLNNFMNAMTGADYTLYPFATTNARDFCNLLDVYLDAVFHPLLRLEDFKQEGHRVEVEEDDSAKRRLVYNGVVFNEMRGVVSEPSQHYAHSLMKTMLPNTHYEHISGGYPPEVLKLTYEELVAFHKRHYHPTNSITITYGEQNPGSWMATLNEYFSSFERGEVVAVFGLAEKNRFAEPKRVTMEGPLNPMGNPQCQKRVSVSFGVQKEDKNMKDIVELSVLDILLSSGPSSPIYQALIESQIGSRYAPMNGYSSYLASPLVSYGVEGVDEARANSDEEVLSAVITALERVSKEGFEQRRVQSVIFQEELQQRHRAADYGVNLCTGLCAMGLCRAENNPLDFIDWLPHLRQLGAEQAKSLLPRISRNLLNNPHRALVSVSAKKDFLDSLRDTITHMEEKLNDGATDAQKDEIKKETEKWLERVRAPQNGDILPTLKVGDIPRQSFQEPLPQPKADGQNTSLLGAPPPLKPPVGVYTIGYPTNGLVYVHGLAPFSAATVLLLQKAENDALAGIPLSHSLLGSLGAGKYTFKELSIATDLVCGGFSFSPQLNQSYCNKSEYITGTAYGFYTTKEKLHDALELLKMTLLEPHTSVEDDGVRGRTLSVAKARCSGVIQRLQHEGNRVATSLAVSHLTRCGAVKESWHGLAQSSYASEMLEKLQSSNEGISHSAVATILEHHSCFVQSFAANLCRGVLWATCEEQHRCEVENMLASFLSGFPKGEDTSSCACLPSLGRIAREDVVELCRSLPIDTSYAAIAIANDLDWTHKQQAPLRVACQLLANEYLHRRVREEGGAYGSGVKATLGAEVGGVTMSSYRDPTPEATVRVFKEAGDWLSEASNVTQLRVDESKLRLFAGIDAPYAADSFGESYFLHGIRPEQKQEMRDALLSVEPKDVVEVARYFDVGKNHGAVVGILRPEERKE
ncbi:metallo-peptidase, Clan ME, Family M16C,putative [Trypanosoma brucei gambiense DAL972]|uniref:Pitrilysin-like metalloprotease, putative n=2 Tax=Trypanosoma brucei TaxID=5691 RepID=C9ZUW1_TRYB9|nr:metallo-peptidase, Clan ME, Family M16C,putative [Trypanosoma brucei gambiense DAL972]RHW71126.1 pitrilysin-like metalloprotease [Trypanosoma brucei equiperdum]CBH13199.1 metallo-peptidase, Clan ME, Family M16C,putative [Trypanosoma brucei gambiense DAL972]|eukprot:XP_011775476.1 metallo-peptidase, Clan ME, Family M16C,putative [Trypanosoma brucei gambiense DAL972]